MLDFKGYDIQYVQKSSPSISEDFLFAEIYKFFAKDRSRENKDENKDKLKYIIRAEMFEMDVIAIKFYPARYRKLDDKYSRLTNQNDAIRIIFTCATVLPILLEKYPNASFIFNSSRTIDIYRDKIEAPEKNQRFRIYSYVTDATVGRKTFTHFAFESISSYLLVNKRNFKDVNKAKEDIKLMFSILYELDTDI